MRRPLAHLWPARKRLHARNTEFVYDLFGDKGAYRYLSELLVRNEQGSYKMQPHNVTGVRRPSRYFTTKPSPFLQYVSFMEAGPPSRGKSKLAAR